MELGKIIVFGVLGLLVFSLWQGNTTTRNSTQKETVNDAEVFVPSPTLYTKEQAAAVIETETLSPIRRDDTNEDTYDSYATYDYVRDRDPGTSNTYSYRVEGCDQFGTAVEGSVNTRGTFGKGYVTNEYGDHFWIVTEWTTDGQLLGFDNEDNTYYLETLEIR